MLKIIQELKSVAPQQLNARKEHVVRTHVQFDDLVKAMEEFGIVLRRPAFLEEKQMTGPSSGG